MTDDVKIPPGWSIEVSEDESQSWLQINGPGGCGFAFSCERGSIRAQILQQLAIDMAPLRGSPVIADALRAPDDAIPPERKPLLLQECLNRIEGDWSLIDGEWGPTKGGLEGAILRGEEALIPKLRSAIEAAHGIGEKS